MQARVREAFVFAAAQANGTIRRRRIGVQRPQVYIALVIRAGGRVGRLQIQEAVRSLGALVDALRSGRALDDSNTFSHFALLRS